jgi:hypothetical protein
MSYPIFLKVGQLPARTGINPFSQWAFPARLAASTLACMTRRILHRWCTAWQRRFYWQFEDCSYAQQELRWTSRDWGRIRSAESLGFANWLVFTLFFRVPMPHCRTCSWSRLQMASFWLFYLPTTRNHCHCHYHHLWEYFSRVWLFVLSVISLLSRWGRSWLSLQFCINRWWAWVPLQTPTRSIVWTYRRWWLQTPMEEFCAGSLRVPACLFPIFQAMFRLDCCCICRKTRQSKAGEGWLSGSGDGGSTTALSEWSVARWVWGWSSNCERRNEIFWETLS